jgi:radical SAM superfamily enzyme YgiQ (UPF0313 family)
VNVLLLGTYEMGRQPFGLASPAAWLREAGCEVEVCDLSRQRLDAGEVETARLVGCYVPMHTAARLLAPVAARVRELNPNAHLCAFGLYASLNADHLRAHGFDTILGPEFEASLTALAVRLGAGAPPRDAAPDGRDGLPPRELPRLAFKVPDRRGLPDLAAYARLRVGDERHVVGYTEASRGCKHRCRHCPIVPVYAGRFRVVPIDVVLEDVMRQMAAGATHVTFGDPDFLNGPSHAMALVERLACLEHGLTFDVTIKIEHLLRHREYLPRLREAGCLFVTSAVESFDDDVLDRLQKRHTRRDVEAALASCREVGLTLVPTFVAFTPWTSLARYLEFLRTLVELDLVDSVAPVQLSIRLLVPRASALLELEEVRTLVGPFDAENLVYPWVHVDPRVDALQARVAAIVGRRDGRSRRETFAQVWRAAHEAASLPLRPFEPGLIAARATVPWLDEPWYC